MTPSTLRRYLQDPNAAENWLRALGLSNAKRAPGNLQEMAAFGVPLDLLAVIAGQARKASARLPPIRIWPLTISNASSAPGGIR